MALTPEELQRVTKAVGTTSTIAASGIARLYLASPDPNSNPNDPRSVLHSFPKLSKNQWTYTNVMGALVFVIDRALDTFMFQIYDLESYIVRFEYELYYDIEYRTPDKVFHAFEMEDCVAGFSFSDEQASKTFQSKVRALAPSSKNDAPVNVAKNIGSKKPLGKKKGGILGSFFGGAGSGSKKGKGSKPAIDFSNIQIGAVTKVVHEQHVGVNVDGTIDVNNLPDDWKRFFKQGGVTKRDLRNPEMVATIRNVMEEAGVSWDEPPMDVPKESLSQVYDADQMRQYEEYERKLREYEREAAQYEQQLKQQQWEQENRATIAKAQKEAKSKPPLPPRGNGSNASGNGHSRKPERKQPERQPRRPQPPALPPVRRQEQQQRRPKDQLPHKGSGNSKLQHKGSGSSQSSSRSRRPQKPAVPSRSNGAMGRLRRSLGRKPSSNMPPSVSENEPLRAPAPARPTGPPKPDFLSAIRGGGIPLKPVSDRPVSVLPQMSTINPSAQESIMAKLKEAMDARRPAIQSEAVNDDSDDDSDWSDM